MESGSELSKTVATFILQKILLDETGLSYICQTFERFSHVASVLVSIAVCQKLCTCMYVCVCVWLCRIKWCSSWVEIHLPDFSSMWLDATSGYLII